MASRASSAFKWASSSSASLSSDLGGLYSAPSEIPESLSSLEPSPSQEGEERGPGSCLMCCSDRRALATSLSPRCDLWRSFKGRQLFSGAYCSAVSSPEPERDDSSYGEGARRDLERLSTEPGGS